MGGICNSCRCAILKLVVVVVVVVVVVAVHILNYGNSGECGSSDIGWVVMLVVCDCKILVVLVV